MKDLDETIHNYMNNDELSNNDINLIVEYLPIIEKEIKKTLLQIAECNYFENTKLYFNFLENKQSLLAKLAFKEKIGLSKALKKFVHDFERLDDPELRKYLYTKIHNKNYFL